MMRLKKISIGVILGTVLISGCSSKEETDNKVQQEVTTTTVSTSPAVKPEQMQSFIEYLEKDLKEKGFDISMYSFYNRDTILYMSVPNDYKYYKKNDLQKFSDGMQTKVKEAFNVWSAINGVDFNRKPMFYIKSEDGDSIASQKMSGDMEVKAGV